MPPGDVARRLAVATGPDLALSSDAPATIAATIAARVAECPGGLFRTYSDTGNHRTESYFSAWQRSAAFAAALRDAGVHREQPVILLIDDVVDFAPAFWACVRAGYMAVPLQSAARESLRKRGGTPLCDALIRLDDPIFVCDTYFKPIVDAVGQQKSIRVIPLDMLQADHQIWDRDAPTADPVCLVPTSGSTGRLKLVALGQDAILYRNFAAHRPAFRIALDHLGTFPIDGTGGHVLLFPRFRSWTQMPLSSLIANPLSVLDAVEQFRITTLPLTTTMAKQIIAAAQKTDRVWDLSSLRQIGLGAETIFPEIVKLLEAFLLRNGAPSRIIVTGYGTTETGLLVNGTKSTSPENEYEEAARVGSCTNGVKLRIVGDDGHTLAEDEVGEVQVACSQKLFTSYWGEPEASRDCFTDDGWWKTGDLGRLRKGELTLHGRSKEVLVVNGRKFSLADIDASIRTVLAVGDKAFSCAIQWPKESTERLAVAFVSADSSSNQRIELVGKIRTAIAGRFGVEANPVLAASNVDIPLTEAGKLRRSDLANLIRFGRFGAGGSPQDRSSSVGSSTVLGTTIEASLQKIWCEILDTGGEPDPAASFFDLGGDSLRSVMLQAAVEEHFAKQISSESFFADPTFANLLRLVTEDDSRLRPVVTNPKDQIPWPLTPHLRNRLLAILETWQGERPTRDRLVVGLNTSGSKAPLFWVFQLDSEFIQLAKSLGTDQPLYGFRSGYALIEFNEDEFQTLALRYLSEILEVCPAGPLFVGGNCQGSIIAITIAQHLLRRERHVPLLILMETGAMPFQSYPGRVFLIHGTHSIYGNPHNRFRNPEFAWRRSFVDYAVEQVPGAYGQIFNEDNVGALGIAVARRMREAESIPARLMPALARRAKILVDAIPSSMVSGEVRNINVYVRNSSPVTWPASETSGLYVGNRWLDEAGALIVSFDGDASLPQMAPNEQTRVLLSICAPRRIGHLRLVVDVVEQGNTWFYGIADAPLKADIEIVPVRRTFLWRIVATVIRRVRQIMMRASRIGRTI